MISQHQDYQFMISDFNVMKNPKMDFVKKFDNDFWLRKFEIHFPGEFAEILCEKECNWSLLFQQTFLEFYANNKISTHYLFIFLIN